ncbi:MAG: hypothetical protein U5N55_02135 [Cypionkella sp.]|nr:hypothetical protein [Cypionkella sp.]
MALALTGYAVIVTKSTVPVGTNRKVGVAAALAANPAGTAGCGLEPRVFLREGAAIDDFMRPDRVVIGGREQTARAKVMADIYRPLFLREFPVVYTGLESRRDDQIRRQRLFGHQDHLHQRNRRLVRKGGGGCQGCGQKAWAWTGGSGNKFLHAGPGYGG